MFYPLLVSSFLIVALGQPARLPFCGMIAGAIGFALFWQAMLMIENRKRRFWTAVLWFFFVQNVQLSWMATTDYMGPLILLVYLILNLALGIQFGALSLLINPHNKMALLSTLAISGVWVFFEWSRLFLCTGFSWNPVGLSLSSAIYPLQMASLFGIYGLSFWTLFTNLNALTFFQNPSRKRGALFLLIALFPYLFGAVQKKYVEKIRPEPFNALLVQTALIPDAKEYSLEKPHLFVPAIEQWERILGAIKEKEGRKSDLIVLPEAALPFGAFKIRYPLWMVEKTWIRYFGPEALSDFPPLEPPFAKIRENSSSYKVSNAFWLQALSNHYKVDIVAGLDDETYNGAFFFHPFAKEPIRYEKQILVPIAEYLPFQWIEFIGNFIAECFEIKGSFSVGNGAKIFRGKVPLSVSICYEETFGDVIRKGRNLGAELLVNLSNDSWFPRSKLPEQHLWHGLIRAVENGVPVLRCCNTGITAAIDSLGQIVGQLKPNDRDAEALFAQIPLRSYKTPYMLWGNGGILFLSAFWICLYAIYHKKGEKEILMQQE